MQQIIIFFVSKFQIGRQSKIWYMVKWVRHILVVGFNACLDQDEALQNIQSDLRSSLVREQKPVISLKITCMMTWPIISRQKVTVEFILHS